MERLQGLCRDQILGRAAGFCGGAPVSRVMSNSLEPGWVPTKMGGAGAPDDIDKAHRTQVWLAKSDELAATVGRHFFHHKLRDPDPATKDTEGQDRLLGLCRKVSGISLGGAVA